jgi:hypothetical protein
MAKYRHKERRSSRLTYRAKRGIFMLTLLLAFGIAGFIAVSA